MDLAWTHGFIDPSSKQSRASRMLAVQRAILGGSRFGVGLDALMHAYRESNDDLMARYQLQRDTAARGQPRLRTSSWEFGRGAEQLGAWEGESPGSKA